MSATYCFILECNAKVGSSLLSAIEFTLKNGSVLNKISKTLLVGEENGLYLNRRKA